MIREFMKEEIMKKVLLIDDLRNFKAPEQDWDIAIARSSAEALKVLQNSNTAYWDIIFLDHDLGGDDTIMPVVDYFCEVSFNGVAVRVKEVVLQTSNPVGREAMVKTLRHYGYNVVPYAPNIFIV